MHERGAASTMRTERGGQEPHAERWRQMDKEPERRGEEGETEKEDGERVQRSEGSAAAAEVTGPHPLPFAHIAPQGLQSIGPGLESGPFLETRRVSPGGPHSAKSPRDSQDYLQAGPSLAVSPTTAPGTWQPLSQC